MHRGVDPLCHVDDETNQEACQTHGASRGKVSLASGSDVSEQGSAGERSAGR
jgi:hypothetical protein